jgi:HYR domain
VTLSVPRKCVGIAALFLAMTAVPAAGGGATGTLNLRAEVRFLSAPASCPSGTPENVVCHRRAGRGVIRGLGDVTATYIFMATYTGCPDHTVKVLAYPALLTVHGKGDLNLAVAEYPRCLPEPNVPGASPQEFTVTGGTGVFDGASGSGTVTRVAGAPGPQVAGRDTWTATVVVPGGFELDLTPPTLSGARSKVVRAPRRAKRVRVRYRVTASDDVDGRVAVVCRPASGSRFRIGRTVVRCSATDTSANTATARFTVTVRRAR